MRRIWSSRIVADLQYDPADILNLLRPIIGDEPEVDYGDRIGCTMPCVRRIGNRVFSRLISPLRTDLLPLVSKLYWPQNADDAIMDAP
jgi:hypothetical protein